MYIPQAFRDASATTAERQTKIEASTNQVEARINMSAEVAGRGLCPECRQPMKPGFVGDVPVQYCLAHRIALPTPDTTEGETTDATADPEVAQLPTTPHDTAEVPVA